MNASSIEARPAAHHRHPVAIACWLLTLSIGVYFVATYVPRYLTLNETLYGPYLWPRAGYLLPHVLGGLVAIVLGPLQFWPRIRNGYRRVHRVTGRVYLSAIVIAALAGMVLATTSAITPSYAAGLFTLSCAWLSTSAMAFIAVRRRDFVQHKEWMIRSYVVTFAFVVFRVVTDAMAYFGIGDQPSNFTTMAWAAWVVPLFVAELAIQGRKSFAKA